jgi:MFS family permease
VVFVLLGARLMEGSSAACAVPTTLVLLSRLTAGDAIRRTRVMGQFEISSLIGMIAGFGVAGVGYDELGAVAFLLLPPLYGIAWWLVPRRADAVDRADGAPSAGRSLRRLAAIPGAVAFGVAWLAINAVVGLWLQYAPFLLKLPAGTSTQRLVGGYTGSEIGVIFGAFGLVFLTGLAAWSFWGGKLPRRFSLATALAGMLGVVFTLALVNHGAPRAVLVLTGLFVLVESGFTVVAFAHLADLTEHMDEARGAALGVYSLLLGLGQLGGSTIGAPFAAKWQMDGLLLATALLALTSLVGVLAMESKRSSASESGKA